MNANQKESASSLGSFEKLSIEDILEDGAAKLFQCLQDVLPELLVSTTQCTRDLFQNNNCCLGHHQVLNGIPDETSRRPKHAFLFSVSRKVQTWWRQPEDVHPWKLCDLLEVFYVSKQYFWLECVFQNVPANVGLLNTEHKSDILFAHKIDQCVRRYIDS